MQAFAYSNSPYPLRPDLIQAHQYAWQKISAPGTWWTGAERVAIAQEVRAAEACEYCTVRKGALSPFGPGTGTHASDTALDAKVIDVVHRLTRDAARLTQTWLDEILDEQFTQGHYVEVISVVVAMLSIDGFHRALGFGLEPLPEPQPGSPSHHTPDGLETETALGRLD